MSDTAMSLRATNAKTLLDACSEEYLRALQTGRTSQWAKMAHSMVDLLAGEPAPVMLSLGTLTCKKCGVDRALLPCPQPYTCPVVGEAQAL